MKNYKKKIIKKIKKEVKGISLIALVVTIIVLLILAGVAINLTIGQNGIFIRAQGAANTWRNAETNEQLAMGELTDMIDEVTTIDGVPIPNGFYYAGGSIDTGLVISDSEVDKKEFNEDAKTQSVPNTLQGNQFVWVPVDNPDSLFITSEIGVKLNGVETTTNIYSNLTIRTADQSTFTAGKPGETNKVREPDILSSCDKDEEYYKTILGFNSIKDMADNFVAEYIAMSDSIKKYKGFYIGRYELTENGEKRGASLTNKNWYELYQACQNVVQGKENVKSTMIYGVQWDAVCSWLSQNGFNTDTDSSSWGNYNSTSKIDTGSNTKFKANEIFDLAGNCWEWTQEAYSIRNRVVRRRILQCL